MSRKYPRYLYRKVKKHRGLRGLCKGCGGQTRRGELILLQEKQVSWFRGDDEVYLYHLGCDPRKQEKENDES